MNTYIITFLGTIAKPTDYKYKDVPYNAEIFPQALVRLCEFDRMYVLVTKEAKEKTYPKLEALQDDRIEPIDIEDGETVDQMWKNFDKVVGKFEENDKVIFDITHGARSIPFLAFLFAAYLKVAKTVEIVEVYYGALVFSEPGNGQVIQMGEFVSMLDWMSATQRFIDLGDGNGLVQLLKKVTIENEDLKAIVLKTAEAIELVSDALIYIRPIEVMSGATELLELIGQLEKEGQGILALKPFFLLCRQIEQKYGELALKDSTTKSKLYSNLQCQLKIIEWYQGHQQQVKSIVLARELHILALAYYLQMDPFDRNVRSKCADILNENNNNSDFDKYKDKKFLLIAWGQVREPRNDYAHVGYTRGNKPIKELKNEIDGIIGESKQQLKKFLEAAKTKRGKHNHSATTRHPKPPKLRSK
jgi:CRISPR-associated DxTHG motif protein